MQASEQTILELKTNLKKSSDAMVESQAQWEAELSDHSRKYQAALQVCQGELRKMEGMMKESQAQWEKERSELVKKLKEDSEVLAQTNAKLHACGSRRV
jgi:hypothetical protein